MHGGYLGQFNNRNSRANLLTIKIKKMIETPNLIRALVQHIRVRKKRGGDFLSYGCLFMDSIHAALVAITLFNQL